MKKLILSLIIVLGSLSIKAQLYEIPDTYFGEALNMWVPNALTYDWMTELYTMDTQHPDVIGLTHLDLSGEPVADFDGIQFFSNLRYLDLTQIQHPAQFPNFPTTLPSSVDTLILRNSNSTIIDLIFIKLQLNDSLEYVDMSQNALNSIPSEVVSLDLLKYLDLSNNSLGDFSQPYDVPFIANTLEYLDIGRYYSTGQFVSDYANIPDSLKVLKAHNSEMSSIGPLPEGLLHLDLSNSSVASFEGLEQLPPLPNGLRYLDLHENPELTTISPLPLPDSLRYLNLNFTPIDSVLGLPAFLEYLEFRWSDDEESGITQFPSTLRHIAWGGGNPSTPPLPEGLEYLYMYNGESSTPDLPDGLDTLIASFEVLDTLPNDLKYLDLTELLSSMPTFPAQLEYFRCHDCDSLQILQQFPPTLKEIDIKGAGMITELPDLPAGLLHLTFSNNASLVELPEFPNGLLSLTARYLYGLECMQTLPNSLEYVMALNSVECFPNFPSAATYVNPNIICNIAISSCPNQEELIFGKVFHDDDQDGVRDPGESPFTSATISGQPGSLLSSVDQVGNYQLIPDSNVTTTVQGLPIQYHTLTTAAVDITVPAFGEDSTNIGYYMIPGIYDLEVEFNSGWARPGFDNSLWMQVSNVGTESTAASIDLTFDDDQTWVASGQIPDTQIGNTATWSATLDPGEIWSNTVTLNTDTSVALGTAIEHMLIAIPQLPDTTPGNNSVTINTEVVGSYDPNDKQLAPGTMPISEVQIGTPIEYTIRFQNTGTFPAERVVITDTLSNDLDWGSMEFISSSHYCTWYLNGGVLHFIHDPIFLPDSNSNEPESHGYVKFRMKPVSTLMIGEQIENVANIYFDFNEPVITDPAIFEVSVPTEISEFENAGFKMYPNPTNGYVSIVANEIIEQIEVIQLDGRVVKRIVANTSRSGLNVSDLSAGVYLLNVKYANEQSSSQILMIE